MVKNSRFAFTAGAAAVGALAISLFIGPAAAQASGGASVTGSSAYWNSSTKVLSSTDTKKDGISSVAQLQYRLNGQVYIATLTNSNGSGTSSAVQNSAAIGIQIRACLNDRSKGTGIYGCSAWNRV
ncbi:MAG: hypothetical protein L0G87_16790 [Renibacterium salmoninarum]|nr:hypothetical protein [Renibacterium salmoninarum]